MREKIKMFTTSIIAGLFLLFICAVLVGNLRAPYKVAKDVLTGNDLKASIDGAETRFNETFPLKNFFVDVNGLGNRLFQKRYFAGLVRLNNGHMTQELGPARMEVLQDNANKITEFAEWFEEEKGGHFIYMQAPWKTSPTGEQIPAGYEDNQNYNADRFLECLGEDVDVIDLRQTMLASEMDFYDYFSKTEHHWTAYGGFHALQVLCQYMIDEYQENIDPTVLDMSNYVLEIPEQTHLGYYGSKAGPWYTGYDQYPLIYPEFETQQTCFIPHKEIVRSGSFYDAIFDMGAMSASKRTRNLYYTYIGGDFPLVVHKSETAKNPGTIMLLIDSFGMIPESFLTTAYQNVIAIDLRWVLRLGWEETTVDFIEKYNPDIVVVTLNPDQLRHENGEQFIFGLPAA